MTTLATLPPRPEHFAAAEGDDRARALGTDAEAEGAAVLATQRCDICGRPHVDPMTLNSTGVDKTKCYQRETGGDPRCKAPRTLSPIAQKAAQLRAELKAAGITASVRSERFSMGQALNVEIQAGSWKRASDIAGKYEKLHRDSLTGEILSGGNTYLHLSAWPKGKAAEVLPACMEACGRLANSGPGAEVEIAGADCAVIRGDWMNTFTVIDRKAYDRMLTHYYVGKNDPIEVAKVVAVIIFKRG